MAAWCATCAAARRNGVGVASARSGNISTIVAVKISTVDASTSFSEPFLSIDSFFSALHEIDEL